MDKFNDVAAKVPELQVALFIPSKVVGVNKEKLCAARKKGSEMRARHSLHTHRNRRRELAGVLERMSKIVSSGSETARGGLSEHIFVFRMYVCRFYPAGLHREASFGARVFPFGLYAARVLDVRM
jgi:hypothetical protein